MVTWSRLWAEVCALDHMEPHPLSFGSGYEELALQNASCGKSLKHNLQYGLHFAAAFFLDLLSFTAMGCFVSVATTSLSPQSLVLCRPAQHPTQALVPVPFPGPV